MKNTIIFLLGLLVAFPIAARDFKYTYEGQTLTYTVISEDDKTCMTKEGTNSTGRNSVSGKLVIPAVAIDGNSEYSVTAIGASSFYGSYLLSSVVVPNSVTDIGERAFYGCSLLTSINLPEQITSLKERVFAYCGSLRSITIPKSVTVIADEAFRYCSSLQKITVETDNPKYSSIDGVLCNKQQTAIILFPGGFSGDFTVPGSITEISDYTFANCRGLKSVTMPNSVTKIGENAFNGCSGLISVTLTNSVAEIGEYAFSGCSNLVSVTIPDTEKETKHSSSEIYNSIEDDGPSSNEIGMYCFARCSNLESVDIPSSVTKIAKKSFLECSGLTSVTIPSSVKLIGEQAFNSVSNLTSITIPHSVTEIADSAFYGCRSLTSITIPNSVTKIGRDAFRYCVSMTSVTIPESVTEIGEFAFSDCRDLTTLNIDSSVTGDSTFNDCRNLTTLTIGSSVTRFYMLTFYDCELITSVYYRAEEPINFRRDLFRDTVYSNATLYVPESAVEKCKEIEPWKNFLSIEAYDFSGINDVTADYDEDLPCEVYTLGGIKVGDTTDNLSPGIYIIRRGNTATKISIK